MLAVIDLFPPEPIREVRAEEPVFNIVPCMMWTLNKNQSAMHAFTFGEGEHAFRFDPIDIREMEYLEFDVYISDTDVVHRWKTGETEFEITSSGTCDVQEYAWSGYDLWRQAAGNGLKLEAGWNHVRLNLPEDSAADFSGINYIRWYWNENGEGREMPGCRVADLKFTAEDGVDPANAHLEPFIPAAVFETEDVPVALADVTKTPYNADPSGEKDSSEAIQNALNDVSLNGGGTVWMPAGKYRITRMIRIPAYVTLRGDWTDPDTSDEYGTLIVMDIPAEDRRDEGTFMLGGCGGVYGLTICYPDQSIDDVKTYPFTFYVGGHDGDGWIMPSVINCTVLNGYRGIGASAKNSAVPEEDSHENMYVMNFRGTFLECGAESYNQSDFGFWDDVRISSVYWRDASRAGILPPVDEKKVRRYTKEHTTGLILGDLEWETLNNITVDSCAVGIHSIHGKRRETDLQALLYGITTENCAKGLVADALYIDNGMLLANSYIEGGLFNTTETVIKMFNVEAAGPKEGRFREDSDFNLTLPVPDSDFAYTKPNAILYTADLDIGGDKDVSSALQAMLDKAGETGGVVYLPGGIYRLDSPVSVPAGVELKGTSAVPTKDVPYDYGYNGTTLLAYYTGDGADDQALVTLSGRGAGLSGIRINYPENHGRNNDGKMFNTSYAVRGTAPDVYIVNSYITSSAYGVDFSGCDHHCVKNLAAGCYRNQLKVGGRGGMVSNCFGNPYMFYITATPYVESPPGHNLSLFELITKNYCDFLILENASDELIYNIAMYGAHFMLTNMDSTNVTAINVSSDDINGIQTVMDGGSLTVVNAMRWGGLSLRHDQGDLRIYNRFEHGFSSGIHGDAVEETYVVTK